MNKMLSNTGYAWLDQEYWLCSSCFLLSVFFSPPEFLNVKFSETEERERGTTPTGIPGPLQLPSFNPRGRASSPWSERSWGHRFNMSGRAWIPCAVDRCTFAHCDAWWRKVCRRRVAPCLVFHMGENELSRFWRKCTILLEGRSFGVGCGWKENIWDAQLTDALFGRLAVHSILSNIQSCRNNRKAFGGQQKHSFGSSIAKGNPSKLGWNPERTLVSWRGHLLVIKRCVECPLPPNEQIRITKVAPLWAAEEVSREVDIIRKQCSSMFGLMAETGDEVGSLCHWVA